MSLIDQEQSVSVPTSSVDPSTTGLPDGSASEAATASAAVVGRWGDVFGLPNVAVHAHLLPDGKVLLWGRRDSPQGTLDDHFCTPQVWDPATGHSVPTPQPVLADGKTTCNLFCSGHTLLPDGRVFVAGGHLQDSNGVNQACIYDHESNTWTALPPMNQGRWYPTATTLPDGRVLVLSGSAVVGQGVVVTNVPQIWDGTRWHDAAPFPGPPPLYPRVHVVPDGRLFVTGTNAETPFLTPAADQWQGGLARTDGERQYAPSVMYEPGKVIYIGGGNDPGPDTPTARTTLIDLSGPAPAWREGPPMAFPRRQHNATLLPDGTVLVTGGTSGPGFNDLTPGRPVHVAELWDPATNTWSRLAAESVDRCYHSTAVLLPDGRVLSAGSGEFAGQSNPADSHRDGQFFHPPYLSKGAQPHIDALDATEVTSGGTITATTSGPAIAKVTLVRLSSVTHAFNATQRINVLPFTTSGPRITASVPSSPAECLPGHYMLFVLSEAGVPSVARIVRVHGPTPTAPATHAALAETAADAPHSSSAGPTIEELDDSITEAVREGALGTEVTVGLTAQCPYGLGGCWGGAYEALGTLADVGAVRPIANSADSTATVYLRHRGLPDVARWPAQLADSANASYHFRGVEVSLTGVVDDGAGALRLTVPDTEVVVTLGALEPGSELAWDLAGRRPRPATDDELGALDRLWARAAGAGHADPVRVSGPLHVSDGGPTVLVRTFGPELSPSTRTAAMTTTQGFKPLNVVLAPRSRALTAYTTLAGLDTAAIASGFEPRPDLDLTFHGGRTIRDLSAVLVYLGDSDRWDAQDRDSIDSAVSRAMTDPGLNDIIAQYFTGPIDATVLPSRILGAAVGDRVFKDDLESTVADLVADRSLPHEARPADTVVCLLLPKGVVLVDGNSDGTAAARLPGGDPDDDASDSSHGLGGYHGSVHTDDGGTHYYAVAVYSAGDNGIVAFDEPWKNVVATLYHELCEARTDPDVEDAARTGDRGKLGWYSDDAGEIGDIPMTLAGRDLGEIMQEVTLRDGSRVPVQLMWSNRARGPEGPARKGPVA
ncbi:MAG TPA: galactose oxidase-like domain-containing protein [Actinomycetospora sp.]|uniref:galactose oxidase-like domain-containing protein n=1 Tax=Actinomycetospora sp. TaxID=1872135 RepID=UPI002F3FC72E